MNQSNEAVVRCENLQKSFLEGENRVDILKGITFAAHQGERVAVVGASGSGKTTLLNLLGGLDLPTTGQVWIDGQDLSTMDEQARGKMRNRSLGFVYQFHHLLMEFTAVENVAMPLLIRRERRQIAQTKSEEILTRLGLSHRFEHKPGELSGGERQRVAIARALVTEPSCVLMDEPTGNLDGPTAQTIHDLMLSLNQDKQTCFIVVTHDLSLAERMDRTLKLDNGLLTTA